MAPARSRRAGGRLTHQGIALVGDGIENPANARVMLGAARLFGADCLLRPGGDWARTGIGESAATDGLTLIERPEPLADRYARRIAFDNLPRATEVYGHRAGAQFAVMVGNERRGLSQSFVAVATEAVQIPMHSARVDCLNVAAASAVALYYLSRPPVRPMTVRTNADARRPALLLAGVDEHFELGSAIRSAAAFGWRQACIEDTEAVWFGVERAKRAEGRAAARRARNDIRLLACPADTRYDADEAVIVTGTGGPPLHRVDLTRGTRQLLVIPAENNPRLMAQDWQRLARKVVFASIDVDVHRTAYHYRLLASIALAECARQVGRRGDRVGRPRRHVYDMALAAVAGAAGEVMSLEELAAY